MAELEILHQRHLIKAKIKSLIHFLSKKYPKLQYWAVKYPFSEKKLKAPMESYNRACKGYSSFIEVFNMRDFNIA